MFNVLEYVRTYIDKLLIICDKSSADNINELGKVLNKLKQKGFEVNAEKSFFARNDLEYLGFSITIQGMMPLPNKVEAIKNIAIPTI